MNGLGGWESQVPIFNALHQGVAIYSRDKQLLLANERARALFADYGADLERPQRLARCSVDLLLHRVLETAETRIIERTTGTARDRLTVSATRLQSERGAVIAMLQIHAIGDPGFDLDDARAAMLVRMLPGIAHDVRGPLTTISGVAQVTASRDEIPEDIRGHLALAREQVERVDYILRSASNFARGPQPESCLPVSLNDALNRCLQLLNYEFRSRRIDVDASLACDLPLIDADPEEVLQLVAVVALMVLDCDRDAATRRRFSARTHAAETGRVALTFSRPLLTPTTSTVSIDLATHQELADRLGAEVTNHVRDGRLEVVASFPTADVRRPGHRANVLLASSDLDLLVTGLASLDSHTVRAIAVSSAAAAATELQHANPSMLLIDLDFATNLTVIPAGVATLVLALPGQESRARDFASQNCCSWIAHKEAIPGLTALVAEARQPRVDTFSFPDLTGSGL